MILLQTDIPEKLLEVSPWNATGFGALVFVLLSLVYIFWRDRQKSEDFAREIANKSLVVMEAVKTGMLEDKNYKERANKEREDLRLKLDLLNQHIREKNG